MENSKIEWTHHTFNPWIGCTRVSPGCVNCYAETMMDKRYGKVKWGPTGERKRTSADYWKQPLKWNREAAAAGERRRVFCASLADVFETRFDQLGDLGTWRFDLWNLIEATPCLDWLLLTKRPENVNDLAPYARYGTPWPSNIWIGTSVENQEYADKRIPELLKIPAAVRFLSVEPMLEKILLDNGEYSWLTCTDSRTGEDEDDVDYCCESFAVMGSHYHGIDWVIVGGESGPNARPMHPDWARSIRDQCVEAEVPFLFKQWGEWGEYSINDYGIPYLIESKELLNIGTKVTEMPGTSAPMAKVGKHRAGRLLDGREWNEFPQTAALPLDIE